MRFLLAACLLIGPAAGVWGTEEPPAAITDPALLRQLDEAFPANEGEESKPGRDRFFELPEDPPLSDAELARLRELGVIVDLKNGRLVFNNQDLTNAMAFHYLGASSRTFLEDLRRKYGGPQRTQGVAWDRLSGTEQEEVSNIFWQRLYLLEETDQNLVRGLMRGRLPSSARLPEGRGPFGARVRDVNFVVNPDSRYLAGTGPTTPNRPVERQRPPSPNLTAQGAQAGAAQNGQNAAQNNQQGGGLLGCNRRGQNNQQEEPQQEEAQEQQAAILGGPGLWLLAVLLARGRRRWPPA